MMKPWTREVLLRKLKALLLQKDTQVHFVSLSDTIAQIEWTPGKKPAALRIKVDVDKDGAIRCVIHELLHVLLQSELAWLDRSMEEIVVLALETDLYEYVTKSSRRLAGWRNAITKRHVEHA